MSFKDASNSNISIRGAAGGPYVVVAQNFVPGTTAADIESVMREVGGEMTSCRLVAALPTVIAEMSFVDRVGAEKVIETFNNKKVRFPKCKQSRYLLTLATGRRSSLVCLSQK